MLQELNCPVCFEQFYTPKALPCQHTFCEGCILRLTNNGVITCPECRQEHPVSVTGFPTNITVERILNAVTQSASAFGNSYHRSTQGRGTYGAVPEDRRGRTTNLRIVDEDPPIEPTAPLLGDEEDRRSCCGYCSCPDYLPQFVCSLRTKVRNILTEFLRRYSNYMNRTTLVFLLITLSRFIAGAVKLDSDCPMEHNVALYLFAKSCAAFLFWIAILILGLRTNIEEILDNRFLEFYVAIDFLFSISFFILGTVWSVGRYSYITETCPDYVSDWNKSFIQFSIFLNVVDWIGVASFSFYLAYVAFDMH